MAYEATYQKYYPNGYENIPSESTPVMAEGMNAIDDTIIKIESFLATLDLDSKYALLTEAGYSLELSIDDKYLMTISLKNKNGVVISSKSIDFPIESMIINASYKNGILTLSLQNGQTLEVNISDIVGGLVSETRKIAGIDLADDIEAEELRQALAVPTKVSELENDKMYLTAESVIDGDLVEVGDIKPWLYDTSGKEVIVGVYDGKPLYRKAVEIIVNCSKNAIVTLPLSDYVTNIDKLVKFQCHNVDENVIVPTLMAGSTSAYNRCIAISPGENAIQYTCGTEMIVNNRLHVLFFEYTKTTDAEGSGEALMLYGLVQRDYAEITGNELTNSKEGKANILSIMGGEVQNGEPTPDIPVEIQNVNFTEIKSSGKNMYDLSKDTSRTNVGVTATISTNQTMTLNGTATDVGAMPYYIPQPLKLSVGDTISLSVKILSGSATIASNTVLGYFGLSVNGSLYEDYEKIGSISGYGGTIDSSTKIEKNQQITISEDMISDDGYVYIGIQTYMRAGDVFNNLVIGTQIELGMSTEYEPHKSSTATFAFTGRAVEVSESDAYTYEKDGKFYVADTIEKIDSGYQIVQRIGEIVFDGLINTCSQIVSTEHQGIYETLVAMNLGNKAFWTSGYKIPSNSGQFVCNKFRPHSNYAVGNSERYDGRRSLDNGILCVFMPTDSNITTIEKANTWLQSNPVTVHAELLTPIITPLSDTDVIQLLSLRTFNEVTHITTDSVIEPIIKSEYGISKSGGQTLESLLTAKQNDLRLKALEALAIE